MKPGTHLMVSALVAWALLTGAAIVVAVVFL